jgi:hypothetical protein
MKRTFTIHWREMWQGEPGSFYQQDWQSSTRYGAYRRWCRFWGETKATVGGFAMVEVK